MSAQLPDMLRHALFLPPEATETSRQIDALHLTVISITFLGVSVISGLAVYYLVRYRRGKKPPMKTPRLTASAWRERGTAAAIGVLFVGLWVVGFTQYLRIETPPRDSLVVYVTAKEWMWKFTYPDGRSTTDNLYVPAGRAVELVMISRDVIHSFYVPAFRVKQDVLPGRYVTTWIDSAQAGTYPIRCAEFCGLSHSGMLGEVRALSPEDYQRFLAEAPPPSDQASDLRLRGERIAEDKGCLSCHSTDGTRKIGPTFRGLFGSTVHLADGRDVKVDASFITRSLNTPGSDVTAGYQNVMPSFQGQLNVTDTAALVELIRSLKETP